MLENQHHAAVEITDLAGETTIVSVTGETEADAKKKAALMGVGYFLYDNGHIRGKGAALKAAQAKDRLVSQGFASEAGFTFRYATLEAA